MGHGAEGRSWEGGKVRSWEGGKIKVEKMG
jgi:hypothetical protein